MKRKDAFRKLRMICQRLDELSSDEFKIEALRLYLFGSVLTDKPDPKDVDVVLVYEHRPDFDYDIVPMELAYGKPTAVDRLVMKLRRGMQQIRIHLARTSLENWPERALLLFTQPRLIWQPGGNWQTALAKIEAEPQPWAGARDPKSPSLQSQVEAMPPEEYLAKITQALVEVESQEL
jgi:hypothetical protein